MTEQRSHPRYHPRGPEEDMPTEVAIAGALIPYSRDDPKARYLGYLACGFAIRDALQLCDRKNPWLSWCRREDPRFAEIENNIPEIRKQLAKEYIELEFYRNFRLALEKDYRIFWKSLHPDKMEVLKLDGTTEEVNAPLTKQEHDYLIKMRSQYGPQQLQIIEAIVSGTSSEEFNWARDIANNPDVLQISRTDTLTLRKGADAEAQD